ncbi:hypothetical protein GUJ93_ZPchr0001g30003 [Zizania palustris]|uniref:Uncharacterized protein n=1 Tax=Zizania palustris TaxID=103762 RepID=A0A8J5S0U0_ZIZPA|nr:hypothetical protein GUJ93_ZPchr0001g30003 [Zizania palustris]
MKKVLRLLAARRLRRRAVSTITATAPATPCGGYGEDEGPFFDLDLSFCSAPASSAESGSESEDSCVGEPDFVISLQRSRSASPSYEQVFYVGGGGWAAPAHLKFCASEPSDSASRYGTGRRGKLRPVSFGSAKAAFYGGRASFSRSSNSALSARFFATFGYGSPDQEETKKVPSGDVIRRYLSKISKQLRRVAPGTAAAAADLRLRKSRSTSAAQTAAQSPSPPRRDDSLLQQQDGIASAIAHCKESLHRASVSEHDSPLLRSRSAP